MTLPEKYGFEFVFATARQIERDLSLEENSFAFTGHPSEAYHELVNQLEPIVRKLMQHDSQFQALLYRVDISEQVYRKLLAAGDQTGFSKILAEAIIQREFQKVLTRKYFSDRDKSG